MLAELKLKLESEELSYRQSSNLQGLMMEHVEKEYAAFLHENRLNPYSQCLMQEGNDKIWYVHTMNEEAYEKILLPLSRLQRFTLKDGKIKCMVQETQLQTIPDETLMKEFYHVRGERYIDLAFLSPAAFKQNGKYVFYPDLSLIYGSLMRKYSASSGQLDMMDEDTLMQLVNQSEIVRYHLKTALFPMEGIRLTGFMGTIRIQIKGSDTIARYIRLLLRFGKFSGVGIKTGMGMGAIKMLERSVNSEG